MSKFLRIVSAVKVRFFLIWKHSCKTQSLSCLHFWSYRLVHTFFDISSQNCLYGLASVFRLWHFSFCPLWLYFSKSFGPPVTPSPCSPVFVFALLVSQIAYSCSPSKSTPMSSLQFSDLGTPKISDIFPIKYPKWRKILVSHFRDISSTAPNEFINNPPSHPLINPTGTHFFLLSINVFYNMILIISLIWLCIIGVSKLCFDTSEVV